MTIENNYNSITEQHVSILEPHNDKLQYIFDNARVGIAICNAENDTLEMVNPAFAAIHGYEPDELIGVSPREVFAPECMLRLEEYENTSTCAINDVSFETTHIRKDGSHAPVSVHITLIKDDNGIIKQRIANIQDISDRKQTESELRITHERFTQIYDNSSDVIYLIEVTPEGRFIHLDINPSYAEVTGMAREEIIGRYVDELENVPFRTILLDKYGACLTAGEKTDYINDYPLLSGVKTFHSRLTPLFDKQGRIHQIVGIARDITHQKNSEMQLRQAIEFNNEIINTIPDLLFELDAEGTYLTIWAQDEALLAEQKAILIGNNVRDILPPDAVEVTFNTMKEVDETGQSLGNTMYIDLPEGRKWFELSVSKKKSSGTYIALSRDITERKEAQDALKKQEQEFRNLSENSPNIIIRYDRDGRQIYVNQAYAYQIGTTVEQAINTKPEEEWDTHLYLVNMNVQEYQERIKRVVDNGEADYFTIAWYRLSDGAYAVHEFYVTVERDSEGNNIGVLAIGHDMTEQKQIQRQLEIKEKEFRSLVENTPDNIARWDTEGRYLYINPVHERTLGKSASEIIGTVIPDRHKGVKSAIAQVVATGNPITVSETIAMQDGTIEYHDVRLVPERDLSGEIVTILGIGRNITERKKMELEIAKQKDFQQTLLLGIAEAGLGVHVIEEGRYIYTNDIEKAKKYGYDETFCEIKPKFIETIHPDDREKALDMYTRRLRGEDVPSTYELGVIQSDGVRREHSVSVIVIPNTDPVQTIVVTQDITERKMMEEMMIQKESRLKEAQKIAKVGSWELEFPGLNLSWSDEIFRIFEIDPNSFQPSYDYFLNTIHPEDRHYIDTVFADSLKNKTPYDVVHRFLLNDGEIKYIHERGETLFDEEGNPIRSVGTVQDITERKSIEKKIEHMAHHDALTGLPNRTLAKARAEQIIAHAKRTKSKAAFLFIDLDGFKAINDTLGHSAGDLMLKTVASRLKECVRESDVISRQGGDEFLLILSDIREENIIASTTQKVLSELEKSYKINDYTLSLSGSIGISLYPDHGETFDLLLQSADTAMYKAKESGKNGYYFYTQQMTHTIIGQFKIQNDLKNGLKNDEFILFYQPQIDLGTNRISGVEALIRWKHSIMGMIPPMNFIPIAEKSGLIVPIGEWVIQEACRQAALWEEMGIDLCVAVNISALQFKRGNLEEIVKNALHTSRINPNRLELELTESIIMHDADNALQSVRNLKALGVQLSIDDFGTGYSSLSYLKRFAVDKLKIDQSFVRDILEDHEDAAIVKTIIQMAKNLNLKTIAEGVENAQVLSIIDSFGCDEVQGYHFAKPMESSEFERFHANFYASES
jgi:diguanylate cyclase (GGDEF)-like protein/PAS domain S-box-containing protein